MARSTRTAPQQALYDVHPGVDMVQQWIADLPQKTGKTLDEWVRLVHTAGPTTTAERKAWLKKEHGLGTNGAGWIVDHAEGKGSEDSDPESYLKSAAAHVEAMYAGPRAGLRPIHDALLQLARGLGPDVRVCPCKTIVPLYRQHVFAQIKPTTRTRLDLGFALKDTEPTGRLLDTGGFAKGDRITHRIPIASVAEIDDEVKQWLRTAYERDA